MPEPGTSRIVFAGTPQFAAIILISIMGIIFFVVLEQLERFVIPWKAARPLAAEA